MKKNIVLTGMRGSGKSTLGKLCAKELAMDFVDTDEEIERLAGKEIAKIVEEKGWKYFRKLEREVCEKVARRKNMVIAVGGGAVMDQENVKNLKKNGFVVFLWVPLEELLKRLSGEKNKRPVLKRGKTLKDEIQEIWEERRTRYFRTADALWRNR